MAQLAQTALKNCPNTKIAISGYSQGGEVVHYAVKSAGLSPSDVSSAVIFGDPELRQSVGSLPSSKVKEFCASGDGVCETGTFSISAAHLSYTTNGDTKQGAQFIQQQAGASGSSNTGAAASSGNSGASSNTGSASGSASSGSDSGLGGFGGLFGSGSSTSSSGSTPTFSSGLGKFSSFF